jgi:BirA family biotin operon repressor/biotin-[acetyl-CoA-carboxylase] ligase
LLDSTNCEAKRLSDAGQSEIWLLALKQTKGRGRREKKWLSGDKDFTASLLTYPTINEEHFSLISYVAGIALYEAVVKIGVSKNDLTLKWPNDLLLNRKKIGGILLERAYTTLNKKKPLVVGFGLNLVSFPSKNELGKDAFPAESLKNSGLSIPEPLDFLHILIRSYIKWNNIFNVGGFLRLREAFLERSFSIGQKIKVKTINNASYGSFSGITNNGSLMLQTPDGIEFITAGDVLLVGN